MPTELPDVKTSVLAVVAPARAVVRGDGFDVLDDERMQTGEDALRAMGWHVVEVDNVRRISERFAGTDDERAAGLMQAFGNPDVDLIMAMRGGYGTARLLPLLDWNAIGQSVATVMGLSDITALNMAMLARCGKPSWQGPMVAGFARASEQRDAAFRAAMTAGTYRLECPVRSGDVRCEGVLWGGNLTVLTSLVGTPYMPQVEGGILFIEDIAEPAWRIERMLDQLANAGILACQKAILVGDMQGSETAAGRGDGHFGLAQALGYIARKTGLPVIEGLPFGHIADTVCIPVGVEARLEVSDASMTLEAAQAPVPTNIPWVDTPRHSLWWN